MWQLKNEKLCQISSVIPKCEYWQKTWVQWDHPSKNKMLLWSFPHLVFLPSVLHLIIIGLRLTSANTQDVVIIFTLFGHQLALPPKWIILSYPNFQSVLIHNWFLVALYLELNWIDMADQQSSVDFAKEKVKFNTDEVEQTSPPLFSSWFTTPIFFLYFFLCTTFLVYY